MITIPDIYPRGGPLYWRFEASGELAASVMAYLHRSTGPGPTPAQLDALRAYVVHWVNAPLWKAEEPKELAKLRAEATKISSVQSLEEWLWKALELGIDPL